MYSVSQHADYVHTLHHPLQLLNSCRSSASLETTVVVVRVCFHSLRCLLLRCGLGSDAWSLLAVSCPSDVSNSHLRRQNKMLASHRYVKFRMLEYWYMFMSWISHQEYEGFFLRLILTEYLRQNTISQNPNQVVLCLNQIRPSPQRCHNSLTIQFERTETKVKVCRNI